MSANHLLCNTAYYIIQSKDPFFLRDLSVHDNLEQEITQFFFQIFVVTGLFVYINATDNLCCFFNHFWFEALMALLPVPWAAILCAEVADCLP